MSLKHKRKLAALPKVVPGIKLNLGCGPHRMEGFLGVDIRKTEAVDVVLNLGRERWPWKDNSVEVAFCSHMVEHLEPEERIHFSNELWRVLVPGEWKDGQPYRGFCRVIVPDFSSTRAYGDLTHKWPPVSDMWFYYLSAEWRKSQAPHNDAYTCDFDVRWIHTLHPELAARNEEYKANAIKWWKNAAMDIDSHWFKKIPNGQK